MKKTLLFLFLTVFALSFNSCSSDDDDNGDGGGNTEITAKMFCSIKGVEIAEDKAPMMLFTNFINFDDYKYDTNKFIFVHKTTGDVKNPIKKSYSDNKGNVKITDDADVVDCVIVVQSGQYPKQFELKKYNSIKKGTKIDLGTFKFTD